MDTVERNAFLVSLCPHIVALAMDAYAHTQGLLVARSLLVRKLLDVFGIVGFFVPIVVFVVPIGYVWYVARRRNLPVKYRLVIPGLLFLVGVSSLWSSSELLVFQLFGVVLVDRLQIVAVLAGGLAYGFYVTRAYRATHEA